MTDAKTARPSRITTDVPFDKDGKHHGFLRLLHSVHRSAYGYIPIPITVIRNGEGPTVYLNSGNHGDEYEGQVTLMRLTRELQPADLKGRVIILSASNFPAVMAGMRTSPIDEGNLNRSFPGDPDGTPTQKIAHYIESELLPRADYAFDLHSGGSSLHYVASGLARKFDEPKKHQAIVDLLDYFGAPVSFLSTSPQGGDQTLTGGAARNNVLHIGTELGGSGQVTPAILKIAEAGVRRLLDYCGVTVRPLGDGKKPGTRLMYVGGSDFYVYAPENGLFEPTVELGDMVKAGDLGGLIHYPDTPWRQPAEARFEHDGMVICKRTPGRTERGDCLFHLGADLAR
jgi:predicted deacylase